MELTVKQVEGILKLSRTTMGIYLKGGKFPNARKREPDKETSEWLIPIQDVQAARFERLASIEQKINELSALRDSLLVVQYQSEPLTGQSNGTAE